MSWSSRSLAAALLLALGGCGFQPLYRVDAATGKGTLPELSAIEVAPISDRVGMHLRERLTARLARAPDRPARYRLTASTREDKANYSVARDAGGTYSIATMAVLFTLLEEATGTVVLTSGAGTTVAFSSSANPYATIVAEEDARKRAAHQLGDQIVTLIARHFSDPSRQNPPPPTFIPPTGSQPGLFIR
jgi:LPS-assembly lipoprotein